MADNDISGYFKWNPAKALYDVSIEGSRFNAEPIMDIIFNPSLNGETPSLPNFKLSGLFDEVSMYNDIVMQQSIINTYFLTIVVVGVYKPPVKAFNNPSIKECVIVT